MTKATVGCQSSRELAAAALATVSKVHRKLTTADVIDCRPADVIFGPPAATTHVMDGDRRDDAQLVTAVLAGDREAFGPLLERWQPSVLRLCRAFD
jgi:hypothetical protein